jgi:acyl-CoA synthetase (AMP-forming)/AMP-acid ligase II
VREAYGMTEASHQMTSNPLPPATRIPGSVGVASGVEVRIVDQKGADAAAGEVAIRGPGVTPGYLNNPEANDASFFDDGWFRTGDRGSLDADGYLRLEGRIKEMILRGGENISPYEIEGVLLAHPEVADAVCFGVADEKYGEVPAAFIELQPGTVLTEEEVIAHCRGGLASFKVPRHVSFVTEWPMSSTKVQTFRLREQLEAELAARRENQAPA